jgi:hypothetical protein
MVKDLDVASKLQMTGVWMIKNKNKLNKYFYSSNLWNYKAELRESSKDQREKRIVVTSSNRL